MTLFFPDLHTGLYLISLRKTQVIWPLLVGVALEVGFIAEYHDTVTELLVGLISVMSMLLRWSPACRGGFSGAFRHAIAVARPSSIARSAT